MNSLIDKNFWTFNIWDSGRSSTTTTHSITTRVCIKISFKWLNKKKLNILFIYF